MTTLSEDWFVANKDKSKYGSQYVHSKGWNYSSLARLERRAIFCAHASFTYHDDKTATCDTVNYAMFGDDGDVVDEGCLSPCGFLSHLQELKVDGSYKNSLVLVVNPPAFVGGLPLSRYQVVWDAHVPHHEQDVPRLGEWMTITQALPGDDESTTFQICKSKRNKRIARVDVWCASTLTSRSWPLHDHEYQPQYHLLRECIAGWLDGLAKTGLRGEDGLAKIQPTLASQGRVTFQTDWYDQDKGEVLGSPVGYDDYILGGRGRFMTTERRMPVGHEYYERLHHYDLNSAYLSIMSEPIPSIFIRSFNQEQIEARGITLGWLRDMYSRRDICWIAEVEVPGYCTYNGWVQVTKWVCDDSQADYSSIFDDGMIPLWVGVYHAIPSMARFARHLIDRRNDRSVDDNVANVVKAVSVTLHMSLGYMGESYHHISRHSDDYKWHIENDCKYLVTHPSKNNPVYHRIQFFPNRPKAKGVTKQIYGTYLSNVGEWILYEGNPYNKRDGRVPHLATWCLSVCSMRVLNMVAGANKSGGYVPWIHTDGLRTTHPIAKEHQPSWWHDNPHLVRHEVEDEVCLWDDGTRMIGGEVDAMPGRIKPLRHGGRVRMLSYQYRHGEPPTWMDTSYDNAATYKAHQQDLLVDLAKKHHTYRQVKGTQIVDRPRRRVGHESLCYDTIGLTEYETT